QPRAAGGRSECRSGRAQRADRGVLDGGSPLSAWAASLACPRASTTAARRISSRRGDYCRWRTELAVIPEDDTAVIIAGRQNLTIRAECHRVYYRFVGGGEGDEQLSIADIPDVDAAIFAAGGHGGVIGAARDGNYAPAARVREVGYQLPGGDIPQVRMAIVVASDQELAVRAERDRHDALGARVGELEVQLPGGDIPQVRMAVAVADGQELVVGAERDRHDALGARVGELEVQLPGGDIPQVRSAVAVTDGQELAVMGERDRIRAGAVGVRKGGSRTTGGDIPQIRAGTVNTLSDGQGLAVGAERKRIRLRVAEGAGAVLGGDIPQADLCGGYGQRGAGGAEGHRWYGDAGPAEREIDWDTLVARGGLHQVDDLNAAAGFGDDDLVVDGAAGQRDGQARLGAGAGRGHGPGAGRDSLLTTHGAGRRIGGDVTGDSRRATAVERHLTLSEVGLDHPHQGFTRR